MWTSIQKALTSEGLYSGPIDGIPGRLTIAGLKAYQRRNGLPETGQADARTAGMLLRDTKVVPAGSSSTPWYSIAKSLQGLREVPGRGSNPTILQWGKDLDLDYRDDDIPWCGLFVGHCIATALPKEPLPSNPLGARNWNQFGIALREPAVGAVAVFWREFRQGYKGHVAFYVSQDATSFTILGGNQKNSVSLTRIDKERLLGFRWPTTALPPEGGAVFQQGSGGLSTDEA